VTEAGTPHAEMRREGSGEGASALAAPPPEAQRAKSDLSLLAASMHAATSTRAAAGVDGSVGAGGAGGAGVGGGGVDLEKAAEALKVTLGAACVPGLVVCALLACLLRRCCKQAASVHPSIHPYMHA